jgi:hypothetical protein
MDLFFCPPATAVNVFSVVPAEGCSIRANRPTNLVISKRNYAAAGAADHA